MMHFLNNRKPFLRFASAAFGSRTTLAFGLGLLLSVASMAQTPKTAQEWYKRANDQYQNGAVDEAIGSLLEALKLNKEYPEALSLLGSAYVESGEFGKAIAPYRHASELKPNDYATLLGYSNALEGAGQTAEELPVLEKLFNLNKSDVVTGVKYLALIEASGIEKHNQAYIALLEDLRKIPNADPTYTVKLAGAYTLAGNFPKAAQTYQELTKNNSESGEYWTAQADAQAHFDKPAAKESYKKAILFTDHADERARLEKAMAALGGSSSPAKTSSAPVVPVAAIPVPAAPIVAAPVKVVPIAAASAPMPNPMAAAKEAEAKAKAEAESKAKAEADAKAKAAQAEAQAAAEKQAKADAQRLANEEAVRKAKTDADNLAQAKAQAEADKKALEAANKQSKEETIRIAKEEAAAKAKAHADSLAQAKVEKAAALEADKKAKLEAQATAKAEVAQKAKATQDSLVQAKASQAAIAAADAKAKAEAARMAKEEAARLAKARADSLAQANAEKKAALEAQKKAQDEAARVAREDAARKAKEKQDSLVQSKASQAAIAAEEAKAKVEAQRVAKEEAARKAKEHADSLAQAKAEKAAAAEAEAKAKAEAARVAREEAASKAKATQDSLIQAKASQAAIAAADAKAKAEAARIAKEEAARVAKARADSLAQATAEKAAAAAAEKKAKDEAARLAREEAARKAKATQDSLIQAKASQAAIAAADAKAKAEAARIAKAEAARQAKVRADSVAQAKAAALAAAEADKKAKEEAARLAREEAARQAKVRADSLAQAKVAALAAAAADKKAKEEAARLAKEEAARLAKARADSLAQVAAEKAAAAEADRKAKAEAARLAKEEAARLAKVRADSLAQVAAEKAAAAEAARKAKLEADRIAKEEAAKLAREEAERKAKAEAERLAAIEADRKAKAEAEKQFQDQVTALITQQPAKVDTAAVLAKIQEKRAAAKLPDQRLIEAEGVINFRQANFQQAVANLGKLKLLSPSANRMMALSLFELKDYSSALKYFQKVPGISGNRVEWGKYIKTMLETRQGPKAAMEYEAYLAKYPDADDALAFLVDYYRKPLQKEKLIPKLEILLAKSPKDATLLTELIGLYDNASPKGIEYRVRYLQVNPGDAKQSLALAQTYEAKGNAVEALKIYQSLAKDAPTDKALNLRTAELLYTNKQADASLPYFEQARTTDPADKKLALRVAGVYEELKKSDQAATTYAQVLETDPKDKAVQAKLFQIYTAKGDKDKLRALLMKIDEVDPAAHQAQFQLAKSFLEAGDKDKAYAYLGKALRTQPANAEYLALLPAVVTTEDQVDAHFAAMEKAALLPSAKPELQAMIARGYTKRKNNAMAAHLYAAAYAKTPKTVEGQREAVVSLYDAKNFELSGALAEKYLLTDDKDRAIREIEVNSFVATKKSPEKQRDAIKGLAALDPDGAASKWSMRLAELDMAVRDTAAAIGDAKSWLDKNPKNVEGWRFLMPLVAKRPGSEDIYIQVLDKLSQLEPANRARYDLELGNLYFSKGSYEDAEKSLLSASKSSPANAQLWYRLGENEMKLRREKEAAEKFRRAYQLDNKNLVFARTYSSSVDSTNDIKTNLPLFQLLAQNTPSIAERTKLAKAFFLTGDFANSAKEWDWLLKGDPSLAAGQPMVADAYMRSGQTAKARGLYEQRLPQEPNNLPLLESIAAIYKTEGNQAGYVTTIDQIVGVDPKYKNYQLALAAEKEKAKDTKGALDNYSAWVSRNPDDLPSLKAMHRLAELQQDTTLLMDALARLNRQKVVDNQYKFQLAEIDFRRSGSLTGIERLAATHPEYKRGKTLLVREYIRQNAKAKLIPFAGFLVIESKTDKTLLEPLADLYAMQKKTALANTAYHDLLIANPKNKEIYTKVYQYSTANASPYLTDVLRIGYGSFPEDMDTKRAYAGTLGKTAPALAIYQEILTKESDVKTVARAFDIAMTLQQTAAASTLLDKWISLEPKDPKVWEQALAVHTKLNNAQRMTEDLEQLVVFYPQRKDLVLQLAKLYEDQKQLDKAVGMYQKALGLEPRNKAVQLKVVALLTAQNRTPELREALVNIDKNDPTAHEAQFQLAKIFLAENNPDQAYVQITKAVRNQPTNSEYTALLPKTVVSDQQVMDNFGVLEKMALQPAARPELQVLVARGYAKKKNSLMAAKLFAEANAKSPKILEGNRDAVVALYDAKNFELGGSLAEKYLAASPTNSGDKVIRDIQVNSYVATKKPADKLRAAIQGLSALDPESAAKWSMRLAELDLAVGDTASAITHSRQWLTNNPKGADGWRFLLPLVAKRVGSEDVYIQVLEKLVLLEPASRARYDYELGNLYFDKGSYEDAEKSLTNAIKGAPANAKLWYRLGETQVKLRKDKESIEKFRKAYQLESGNLIYARSYSRSVADKAEIKANLALFKFLNQSGPSVEERKKLAQAYFLNGDFVNSAKEWDWLVKSDSALAATEPMVSDAYMRSGQTGKARGLYEKRLVTEPNNLELLESVAGIYKQENNQKGYIATVDRIVTVDPKYKGYQMVLAVEKEKAKDFKGALQEYAEWVGRNEEDQVALKAMHRLSDQLKDTANLMDALVRLNRKKNVEPIYAFQLAEVDYVRSGNIDGIEKLVKLHPEFRRGKVILIKSYYKKGAFVKMTPFTAFLAAEAKQDRDLAEPLGDLYAYQKKSPLANEAYFDAVRGKKDRVLFDKAYKYGKEHDSPYRAALLKQGYESFPDDSELKFDYAVTLGKTPKALDLYNEVLVKDHNHLGSLRNGSEIAVAMAKTDMAAGLLQRWASLEPDQVRPWTLLVDIYTQGKNDNKLAEALERLSALSPKNGDLAYKAAMAQKKIGNKDKAQDLLTKAVALTPTNALYQREFGLSLVASNQLAKAKNPLLIADRTMKGDEAINSGLYKIYVDEKNPGLARERMRTLFSLKPGDKNYAFALARLESDLKSPAEAVRILERPNLKDSLNAEMAFLLLDGYFKLGQKDRAAALGPQLIRKYPNEAKQSLPLAILFYETKNRPKAKEILESYTRNNTTEEGFYYLGKVYFDEKNWQGAINNLTRADAKRADVLNMLGQAYIANKEPDQAIKAYEDYYTKTKDIKVLADLYNLYKKTNDEPGTRAILERLIAAQPLNYDYRVELAELYRTNGDVKKAESQYEMILKKMPSHPASNMNLGMILAGRKDYTRSIKMLETGLTKYPDSATAWRYLGDAYRSAKRFAPALDAYKKAFKLQNQSLPIAIAKMQMTKEIHASSELPSAYADVVRLDSGNVEAASALADIRFSDRKYEDAAALYGRITSGSKNIDKGIWANYGLALLETKRIDEAKRAFQRAVDLGEKSPRVMISLARIYKEQGNAEKAESILTEMVKKDRGNHLAYYWLGQLANERNQPGVAEDFFKKAQNLVPSNGDYAEALARMNYNKDEFSQALRILEPVHTNLSSSGHLMYGDCLMKQGKNEAALAEFNTVFAKDPSGSVLAKLAELQINKGNYREAIRTIETSDYQLDTSVQFALAKAQLASHEHDKARDILERLIRGNKYNAAYYHYRGMTYFRDKDYSKAKKDFDQALKYNPDYMESVYHVGLCLLKSGSTSDAKNYFKELSQHSNPANQAKGYLGLAMTFEFEKKYEAAENFLQKSVEASESPEALSLWAKILLKMRKPTEAESHAKRALELQPGNATAIVAMGDVLLAQGRKGEALALAKRALEGSPSSCELLIGSAKINLAAGNFETSKANCTYAMSVCPDEAVPYFYSGVLSDKKYLKKEAKEYFKAFKKHGGDAAMIPADYR